MTMWERIVSTFEGYLHSFLTVSLWRILGCIAVIVVALLIKGFISKCVFRIVKKKLGAKEKTPEWVITLIDAADRPVQLLVMTLAIFICTGILRLYGAYSSIAYQTVETLIIVAVFWVLFNAASIVKNSIMKVANKSETKLDNIAADYIAVILRVLVFVLGALCVLQVWVNDITGLLAGLSIGGIAIALAAQDTAANFFGSLVVMLDRPFDIGEYVEVDGVAGTVEHMGLRSTRIRTLDQSLIIVPNKTMSSANITNWTKIDRRRVTFNIGVTYSTTKAQLEELINRIDAMLHSRDDIRKEDIMVGFADFGDSALLVSVRFYTLTGSAADAAVMRGKVNFAIMDIVNEMGLSFAFPSQSVYIESAPKS